MSERNRQGLHRDWRFWTGVLLMLAAIGMYVASLDDEMAPTQELEAGVEPSP
jgi:hypothetical protein